MTSINFYNNLSLVTLHFPSSTSCHCPDHVHPNSKSAELPCLINAMTSINLYNNLLILTILLLMMLLEEPCRTLTPSSLALVTLLDSLADLLVRVRVLRKPLRMLLSLSVNSAGLSVDTRKISELSQRVTQEINDINQRINSPNNLNNLPSSPSPSAELDKLQSKLQALKEVEELCGFLTNRNNASNEPKKLLENLCSGLETFLGFHPSSKGYDGTGIVYSDLDRLCDAVMGFLSGVLSAVKDDEAVKTYDNYMAKKLSEVLKEVNNNIGSGRTGLVASVGAVKGWLDNYLLESGTRTSRVTGNLGRLKDEIAGTYTNNVAGNADQKLETQLTRWTETLQSIELDVNNTENQYVNLLDHKLKNTLLHETNVIMKSVQVLQKSAGNAEFKRKVQAVDEELKWQKEKLDASVKDETAKVQKTLQNEFENIFNEIRRLTHCKWEHFKTLRPNVIAAKENLVNLNVEFKTQIIVALSDIKGRLDVLDRSKTYVGAETGKSKLQVDVVNIRRELGSISDTLEKYEYALSAWMKDANKLIEKAINVAGDILNKEPGRVIRETMEGKAGQLKNWKDEIGRYLESVKTEIKQKVEAANRLVAPLEKVYKKKLVDIKKAVLSTVGDHDDSKEGSDGKYTVLGLLNKLDDHVKTGLIAARDEMNKKLKTYIENELPGEVQKVLDELVKPIYEMRSSEHAGELGLFVKNVSTYAGQFKATFEQKIEDMVTAIVNDQKGVIKSYLNWYVDRCHRCFNKSGFNGNPSDIVTKLTPIISVQVKKLIQTPLTQTIGDVHIVLGSIGTYLAGVADAVDARKVFTVVKGIEDALEVREQDKTASPYKSNQKYLTMSLQTILTAMYQAVKGAADRLQTFIAQSQISALHTAIGKVQQLGSDVKRELGTGGNAVSSSSNGANFSKTVAAAIDSSLKQVITGNGTDISGIDFKEKTGVDAGLMSDYLKQTQKGAAKNDDTLRGKIENIKKHFDDIKRDSEYGPITINGIEHEANNELKSAITGITTYADAINVEYIKNALDTLSTESTDNLNEITKAFSDAGSFVRDKLNTLRTYKIDDYLNKTMEDIKALRTTELNNVITTSIKSILVVIDSLEQTPQFIDEKRQHVEDVMDKLKNEIGDKLDAIDSALNEADKYIQSGIDDVENTVRGAKKHAVEAIENLKHNLLCMTEYSFKSVTAQVRSLFAESHRADLSALKTLLSTQLKIITCTINKNLNTGLKGFLKTLSGDSIDLYAAGHDMDRRVKKPSTRNLLDEVKTAIDGAQQHGEKVKSLSSTFNHYSEHIFTYLLKDMAKHFTSQPDVNGAYTTNVTAIQHHLTALLDHISAHKHFDHQVPGKLETLKTSLTTFTSSHFGNASYPVLDAFPQSLVRFVGELERVYVSRYEGEVFTDTLMKKKKDSDEEEKITDYGTKLSKVCLSMISIINSDITLLNSKCDYPCQKDKINEYTELGGIMRKCGFGVSTTATKQDGELRNKDECTGSHILEKLGRVTASATNNTNLIHKLDSLNQHLHDYYRLCHIMYPSKRQPSSVYEMLVWLSGLRCNPVYDELLLNGLSVPFEDPEKETKEAGEDFEFTVVDPQSLYLNAYPKEISYNHVVASLEYICSNAYDLLSTILGTGNTYTLYSVDYCTNALNLRYPSVADDCLHSILDILRRMFPVLRFMHVQCMIGAAQHGWSDCRYGKDIPSAKRPCIDHLTDKEKNQLDCLPTYSASGQPTCQPNCQPNSPLMSYLNDCLPGHLPHQLTDIGCKAKCSTCPKSTPGMPCLTPLGFRGFSGTSKTGKEICNALDKFFDDIHLSSLFSLVPKPPSTLPEHFNFALSLVTCLNSTTHVDNKRRLTFGDKFGATIIDTSINLYDQSTKLTEALRNAYGIVQSSHTGDHSSYELTPLSSLSMKKSCVYPNRNVHCGPYIQSLWNDSYTYLAEKHADHYLSWALYLPWTLYDYLRRLLQDFQNISCRDWGCSRCQHGGKCMPGKHGVDYNCKCRSLVGCRGVQSTFYRYGFTFGNSMTLLESNGIRYCRDFSNQLTNVLNSEYFKTLFEKCDEFIFTIRQPFIWLNVALWSLSLFYLICVMLGRLDVLHIKSHLRIPSSHKITAQSLLAAAQVGRLAKISYLQP
ncbi:hypothetical protein, conserved [Babesia bigemina]|uniref:C3H1-type domain-containing protein n=1 Tax=Babesia bigemina TaxID=5866 RepID=A0A061D5V2_BABBI|nr:hypothetical protein, conserved [Babesia bigemina]CDR96096.1 hypothetical protein, conserved [Babesia bigemina]|eukprot:XP_012768282.1 hypothetical protein, conserved [Babesia bigemina]